MYYNQSWEGEGEGREGREGEGREGGREERGGRKRAIIKEIHIHTAIFSQKDIYMQHMYTYPYVL